MTGSTFKDAYSLPRDKIESIRLEDQHRMIIQNAGFVLHPILAANLPENARIADIATGTGIWMKDVAATAPKGWSFTGFDLSDTQFPPADQRGGHSFELLNILEPIPQHLEQTFDAVHIRYLICALNSKGWITVAQNIFKLLKPGGYLQWFESDFPNIKALQSDPQIGSEATYALRDAFFELQREEDRAQPDAVNPSLKRNVLSAGFENVREDVIASDRVAETRKEHSMTGLRAVYGGTLNSITKKGGGWVHDEKWVEEMYQKAVKEAEGGVYLRWDMHVITARRPQ